MQSEWSSVHAQMQGTFIEKQMGRVNRNLLALSVLLVLAMGWYGAAEWRYFYNFFGGPFGTDANSLDKIREPETHLRYFVSVKGEESTETGLQDVEQQITQSGSIQSETVKAEYTILVLGKRLLIVKRSPKANGTAFQGAITELPSDIRSRIVAPLLKEYPHVDQAFLPVMLDATGFRDEGYVALAICIPVALFATWNIRKVIQRRNNPQLHPIVRSTSRYGSLVDTAQQIDAELGGSTTKMGKATITPSWVLLPSTFALAMCHIPDVVWAYQKVTKHSINFIPTGKTYAVIMFDRYGVPLQVDAPQKKADTIMRLLGERTPWAIFGYSAELNRTVRADWGGLVAAIDARHSGASAHAAGS